MRRPTELSGKVALRVPVFFLSQSSSCPSLRRLDRRLRRRRQRVAGAADILAHPRAHAPGGFARLRRRLRRRRRRRLLQLRQARAQQRPLLGVQLRDHGSRVPVASVASVASVVVRVVVSDRRRGWRAFRRRRAPAALAAAGGARRARERLQGLRGELRRSARGALVVLGRHRNTRDDVVVVFGGKLREALLQVPHRLRQDAELERDFVLCLAVPPLRLLRGLREGPRADRTPRARPRATPPRPWRACPRPIRTPSPRAARTRSPTGRPATERPSRARLATLSPRLGDAASQHGEVAFDRADAFVDRGVDRS